MNDPSTPSDEREPADRHQPTQVRRPELTAAEAPSQLPLTPAGGLPLAGPTSDDLAAVAGLPPGSALLIAHRGPQTGARFLLDRDLTTAGRDGAADVFLDDVTVSRKHAEFHRTTGLGFTVKDSGSLNGTYVNGVRVEEQLLGAGDEVRIGKFRLTFHPPGSAPRHGG